MHNYKKTTCVNEINETVNEIFSLVNKQKLKAVNILLGDEFEDIYILLIFTLEFNMLKKPVQMKN